MRQRLHVNSSSSTDPDIELCNLEHPILKDLDWLVNFDREKKMVIRKFISSMNFSDYEPGIVFLILAYYEDLFYEEFIACLRYTYHALDKFGRDFILNPNRVVFMEARDFGTLFPRGEIYPSLSSSITKSS